MDECYMWDNRSKIDFIIIICWSVIYISWSSDFAYYFEDYLRDECHIWFNGLM